MDEVNRGGAPEGNQNRLIHGGEGALKRVQQNKEFIGVAKAQELEVERELEEHGRFHLVRRNAIRLQTCTDLFWGAIVRLTGILEQRSDGNAEVVIAKMDKLVARFGWLAGASLRAWQQMRTEEEDGSDAMILDAIAEVSGDD